ncbi:MAG: FAD:protein FMN transferase [Spirochaetaceae bacterium]|jgi:thiamine biosynthesis lipoprotein|nr:FAD:protein FMN transferase [Spirochaetaceae bacterium]
MSKLALGTVCSVRVYQKAEPSVFTAVFKRLSEIEDIFSPHIYSSNLNSINENSGVSTVRVPNELIFVLKTALYYAEISDGAFNPALGPLIQLWDIGGDNPRIPSPVEIENALSLCSWRDVEINEDDGTVFLRKDGMALDLGAIVKGYAADETARILKEAGVKKALIDFGGNILALGAKQEAGFLRKEILWRIGVQDPVKERGDYVAAISVKDATLVTSGVYERFFEKNGVRYHHILSFKTGMPVENSLASVTIIQAADAEYASMQADALSTTIFALGCEQGPSFLQKFPGTEAVFILKTGEIMETDGLKGRLSK